MMNITLGQVIGIPVSSSTTYTEEDLPSISLPESESASSIKERKRSSFSWLRKFRKGSEDLSKGHGHGKGSFSFLFKP
jgi:hypothetical protein